MESQVSRLAKFGIGKLAMRVTCISILIILQAPHNILHILYHVVHIILSYAMRPWNHGLDIRTSQNEGSMGPQLGSLLSQTQSLLHSFIRTSFPFIHGLV